MKRVLKTKLIVLVLLLSFMTSHLSAQNNGIFFQAVARDKFSNPAKDRKIFVQSTIIQSSATGTQALIEEHQTNTDASGVFSISLGNGLRVGGASSNLASIDWPKGPFFLNLKVAITPIGSNSNWEYSKEWIDMGTTNFGAVPFAFYAANAAGLDQKINFSDTTKFLLPYAKKIDVQALATNVDTKLATKFNLTDTIKYSKLAYTDSFFNKKLNIADSANGYVTPTMLAAKSFDQSPITNSIGLKLNITDSVSKYVTPTMLAAKTFDSAAMYNRMSLKANITDLVPLVNSITLNTANISVNTSSITANSSLITTETARARAAELALSNNIASNTASITANATAITTESTTARAAELILINSVASNTASITSNTSNFVTLNTKVASNTASITANSIAITSESTTARAAELTLTNSVVSNTASITSNTSDIVTLNTNVASNSASIIANTTAITSESTTARAAELTLTNSVVSNTASITSNTSDIVTLNTNVASNTASITANTTAITSESTTARAAELTLTNSVVSNTASITSNTSDIVTLNTNVASNTASITANTNDIAVLNTNIASNTTSITANTTAITSETTTARAAEFTLTNNVAANTASITANLAVINLKAPIASPTFIGTVTTGTLNTGTLTTGSVTLPTTHGSANQVLSTTGSGTLTWTTVSSVADASTLSGTITVAKGGTGATNKSAAFDALSPMTSAGDIIYGGLNGTGTRLGKGNNFSFLTLDAGGLPTWTNAIRATSGTTWNASVGFSFIGGDWAKNTGMFSDNPDDGSAMLKFRITGNSKLTIDPNNVAVLANTASTSKTTGSLIVSGGLGVGGDIYASNLNVSGAITAGTWSATAVDITHGGTGATSSIDARTNLGLSIGTNIQQYNQNLDAISNLTISGADQMIYTTSSNSLGLTAISEPARTLIAQPSNSNMLNVLGAAPINATINTQAGSYTLTSTDNGKIVILDNGSDITLTVPAGLAAGFNCMIVQKGAGLVTITPASTVTVTNRSGGTKTGGQNAIVTIISISSNYFITGGDMQ